MVECDLAKVEVASSNLVSRSKKFQAQNGKRHGDFGEQFHAPLPCIHLTGHEAQAGDRRAGCPSDSRGERGFCRPPRGPVIIRSFKARGGVAKW